MLATATALVAIAVMSAVLVGTGWEADPPLLRVTERIPQSADSTARPLVLTLGGPVYCAQSLPLANRLHATVLCPDYGRDGERTGASRARRVEDWGDPTYLAAVARLPEQLRQRGVKISELILVGASYAGYAAAELVSTHPELHPRALIIVDSFLDLPERFQALSPGQPTRAEMIRVLGGTLANRPRIYEERSPSHHLAGLVDAMRHGMRLLDVWSIAPAEEDEFNGGMCSLRSNAYWLRRLSMMLHRPVTGYVTQLPHAVALWDWWPHLLALADLVPARGSFPATAIRFRAGHPIASLSYCADRATTGRRSALR